jgi:hypothetical protein
MKPSFLILSAILCIAAPVGAQQVYKCGSGSYSQKPCSQRTVNTEQAPVPAKRTAKDTDVRRMEQNRVLARSLRQKPGETAEQFAKRQRRARMMETDRDECARLDARIPVEQARMNTPDSPEVIKAEAALVETKKRFAELRC